MQPDALFSMASTLAVLGWLALAYGVARRAPAWRDGVAGIAVPALLSLAYLVLVLVYWSGAEGGYGSLQEVAALFRSPWILLAGWVHYLAFDLFVGAWIARDLERVGLARWVLLPILPLTFLFGPVGLLGWLAIRQACAPRMAVEPAQRQS